VAFISASPKSQSALIQYQIGGWLRRMHHPVEGGLGPGWAVFHLLSLFNPIVLVEALVLFGRIRPRVVHTHNLMGLSPAVWLAARIWRARTVHTHHDFWALCERATLTTAAGAPCQERTLVCLGCRLLRGPKRLQFGLVATEIFPSRWARSRLGRRGAVIPSFASGAYRDEPAKPTAEPPYRLVYLGGLHTHKGVLVLLEAFARLTSVMASRIELVIAGSGPLATKVESLAADVENVRLVGRLDPASRDRLLSAAHLVVIPSTWPENSPVVFFEALAMGLPVVASDTGGLSELRRFGNVVLVPPGNARALAESIEAIFTNPNRLAALGAAAFRRRQFASPRRFMRQCQAVLRRV